ncbi:glutathione S-transferase zeta class [Canna indica]|uniref:glutathione transferase n=1 Tax=Canna indica TaxID=4628 RepID=A0AAQ3K3G4_9LILI|nr:glutathione S-transferase zeta class [Canna indica]
MAKLILYSNWFSSCSQRVRIALNLKELEYEYKAVDLLKGEQSSPEYEKLNPIKYVPTLVDGDAIIADSFAILLYLEDKYPQSPLIPRDPKKKALNIQIATIVSSSIQPLHKLSVPNYFGGDLNVQEGFKIVQKAINDGFKALEKLLKEPSGKYATGDEIQLADVFLAPQIHAGVTRFQIDMSLYPTLSRLNEAYNELPAFQAALPLRQPDAPSRA